MIYFAAPLFNEREMMFNRLVVAEIENYVTVFLPQRNGTLLADMLAAGVPHEAAARRVFLQDCDAMARARALIGVLDGGHIDEGVAFEIGYMCAAGKTCVGLQTDVRRALPTGNNPMISCSLTHIFSREEDLVDWVKRNSSWLSALEDDAIAI